MKEDYKGKFAQLKQKVHEEPARIPVQEVRPVEIKPEKPKEAQVNFWVPEDLMKRLKIHAVNSGKTIKQVGIEAFEEYLQNA